MDICIYITYIVPIYTLVETALAVTLDFLLLLSIYVSLFWRLKLPPVEQGGEGATPVVVGCL